MTRDDITKKEAIKIINIIKRDAGQEYPLKWHLALNMAIKALEEPDSLQEWISKLNEAIDILDSILDSIPLIEQKIEQKREECEEREQGLCPFYAG